MDLELVGCEGLYFIGRYLGQIEPDHVKEHGGEDDDYDDEAAVEAT